MIVNKVASTSGEERAYWNYRSLQSLYDTAGLGIGLGSSRASSWIIAVLSQLGIAGSLMFGVLIAAIVRSGHLRGAEDIDPEIRSVVLSVRAACPVCQRREKAFRAPAAHPTREGPAAVMAGIRGRLDTDWADADSMPS
jgi:hypothetical protein